MDDQWVDLGDLTQENDITYRPEFVGFRPMEHDEHSHAGVVFEMDLDMTSYDRRVYTVLDWLSDVGGLAGAMFAGIRVLSLLFLSNDLEWYLISKLYKRDQL